MKNGPHILISSDSGTGKSTFAATMIQPKNPKPVLIQAFDANDKLTPYRRRGSVRYDKTRFCDIEVIEREGKVLAVIERFHERYGRGSSGVAMHGGAKVPTVQYDKKAFQFEKYLERMKEFEDEVHNWYGLVLDSTTSLELCVRAYLSGRMRVKDPRMVWGQATDELERLLMFVLPDLPITAIVLSHTDPEQITGEDGKAKYKPRLPGRLGRDVLAAFGEIYRGYFIVSRENGEISRDYFLQTKPDNSWRCGSQLGVPDPMEPHFKHVRAAFKQAYGSQTLV